jgi:c-di-GMP-binding flagellar brake protein YcgR
MDDLVKVDIDVGNDDPPIHARGRVVRVTAENHKGVRIEMIEEGDRERLIHFVFERQRSQPRVKDA